VGEKIVERGPGGHAAGAARTHGRGQLDVIATPIGNLSDVSERARTSLAAADVIAAEDTRRTLTLLTALGVSRPLVSLHAHNEAQRLPALLARLAAGERIALVSDAGTPLVSDPGFELVREAAARGHDVRVVPGPSAVTAALAIAGLPTERFCFEGFLPSGGRERRERLAALASEPRTLVLFEAPHRVAASLADLAAALGPDRPAALARELTKVHETIYRATLAELAERARGDPDLQRGEITLVVQGAPEGTPDTALLRRALALLLPELPPAKAAAIAAQLTGMRRSDAYAIALELGGGRDEVP